MTIWLGVLSMLTLVIIANLYLHIRVRRLVAQQNELLRNAVEDSMVDENALDPKLAEIAMKIDVLQRYALIKRAGRVP